MARRTFETDGLRFMGRPRTARSYTWTKEAWITDDWHPHGVFADVTPLPGHTYTRATWPPRGRGRGESLISIRRIEAKFRAIEVMRLHGQGYTFAAIGPMVGLSASGAYRAMRRLLDRVAWNQRRARQLSLDRLGLTEADLRYIQALDDMGAP